MRQSAVCYPKKLAKTPIITKLQLTVQKQTHRHWLNNHEHKHGYNREHCHGDHSLNARYGYLRPAPLRHTRG